MNSFFSIWFIVLVGILFVIYYALPNYKTRNMLLLFASYVMYGIWNIRYVLVLMIVSLVTYLIAQKIEKSDAPKSWTTVGIGLILFFLVAFRYWNIVARMLYDAVGFANRGGGAIIILLPLGLSYYTLVAIGYLVDVYRGKCEAEKSIISVGLLLAFFPCVIAGPIERGTNLLHQFKQNREFEYDGVKEGLLYVGWGYFLKLLVADRIAQIVNPAFDLYFEQTGATLLLAVILYALQLYADFSGYSYIAIGTAKLFGIHVMENFKQPYFAVDVKDFWNRWHISLSSWLRDYVYIPLGGNRKGKGRQLCNLMVTFLVSGLWHGNGIHFWFWGLLHGLYQCIAKLLPSRGKHRGSGATMKVIRIIGTFILVDLAWLFFRAPSVVEGLRILKRIMTHFDIVTTVADGSYLVGYEPGRAIVLILELVLLLVVDIVHEKGIKVGACLNKAPVVVRWVVYYLILFALIFGVAYNYGGEASAFIYAQF